MNQFAIRIVRITYPAEILSFQRKLREVVGGWEEIDFVFV